MNIRVAKAEDSTALLGIYRQYIENTAVSFEYDVPGTEEFRRRISHTLTNYPYLVAEEAGKIVGYAYAGQFHTRRAFIYGAELSIYLDWDHRRKGIGRKLYERITEILSRQNVLRLYACIAVTDDPDDPFLTDDSVWFHARQGFIMTARHDLCGYKFGRWYGIVWMEKSLSEHCDFPEPFIPFPDIAPFFGLL